MCLCRDRREHFSCVWVYVCVCVRLAMNIFLSRLVGVCSSPTDWSWWRWWQRWRWSCVWVCVCVCWGWIISLPLCNGGPGEREDGRALPQRSSLCVGEAVQAIASWSPAFCEAPCLMGGREVNSTAPKLYLIFIHMNALGRDRLLQTNWNAWDWVGFLSGKQKKTVRIRGGGDVHVYVSMNFCESIRKGRNHWYGWKDTNHSRILIFSLRSYIYTSII